MNTVAHKTIRRIFDLCLGLGIGCGLFLFLAQSRKASQAPVITIAQDGSLYLAREKLGLNQLSASLKKQTAKMDSITIQADVNSDYTRAIEVVNVCKAAGASRIAIHTLAGR